MEAYQQPLVSYRLYMVIIRQQKYVHVCENLTEEKGCVCKSFCACIH